MCLRNNPLQKKEAFFGIQIIFTDHHTMEKGDDSITEDDSDVEQGDMPDTYRLINAVNNNSVEEVYYSCCT